MARTLIIKNLGDHESGNYSCLSANNPKSRVEFRMSIKEPRMEFVQRLTNAKVATPNEKVIFECITRTPRSIDPYMVRWFKNGVEIIKDSEQRLKMFNYCKND